MRKWRGFDRARREHCAPWIIFDRAMSLCEVRSSPRKRTSLDAVEMSALCQKRECPGRASSRVIRDGMMKEIDYGSYACGSGKIAVRDKV
jgi:hypothetical protein